MSHVWLLKSNNIQMLVLANDYHHAREQFKNLLKAHVDKESYPILDEIIEITKINEDNSKDEKDSYVEFTETWLKELGIPMDIIVY